MKAVVIGGGVIGLCSAYSLSKRGFEVSVVDRGEGPSTSTINAGMIVPSHIIPLAAPGMVRVGMKMMLRPKSPFWIRPRLDAQLFRWMVRFARSCNRDHVERSKALLLRLNAASKQGYLDMQREIGGFEVMQKGLLMIARQEASLEEESHVAAQVRELGLPAEVLDADAIAKVDPGIRIRAIGGVHYLADSHFSPPQFMAALRKNLEERGVEFASLKADRLAANDGRLASVATATKSIDGDVFVLAAGAWSGPLAATIGLPLPMQAGKGYSFDVEKPVQGPTICAILMEGRVAVTPLPNGVRFGGTMEIGPTDDRITPSRVQGIREAIPNYYPSFAGADLSSQQVSVGLRPCTPDGLPYLGKSSKFGNLIVATGHAMMGMSLGPVTGEIVGDLAAGLDRPDIAPLQPDRFG